MYYAALPAELADFKDVGKAAKSCVRLSAELNAAERRLDDLRGELPRAEAADRDALAQALLIESAEPKKSAAEFVRQEIDKAELRLQATKRALALATDDLSETSRPAGDRRA
jgi:chromosome segregation ATPase